MQFPQQLKLVNESNRILVITPDPERPKSYLRFEPFGDEMDGHERYVTREVLQQPDLIKAIQRGLLCVEGLPDDDPMKSMLQPKKRAPKAEEPLTVQNVIFDEANEYKPRTEFRPVKVDPLVVL
ncbi:hypothetical protein ACFZAM_31230 [Streptomyces sp. NPDC008079]|uniref:hypothetical protein n=1 Tax=Streptomyces sp. NPDC008079 TaxID=3364806 RepID=UPI0036E33734